MLTGIDRRSDTVVGFLEPHGMIKLTMYLDDDNLPETNERATNSRGKVFNEEYKPIRK